MHLKSNYKSHTHQHPAYKAGRQVGDLLCTSSTLPLRHPAANFGKATFSTINYMLVLHLGYRDDSSRHSRPCLLACLFERPYAGCWACFAERLTPFRSSPCCKHTRSERTCKVKHPSNNIPSASLKSMSHRQIIPHSTRTDEMVNRYGI